MIRIRISAAVLVAVLASTIAPAQTDAAPGLQTILEDARSVALATPGITVRNRTARIGHFEVALAQATVFPLTTKGGDPLGLYVDGQGSWSYRSEDPGDVEVFRTNAKRMAHELSADGSLSGAFTKAIILFTQPELSDLTSGAAEGSSAGDASGFDPLWKKFQSSYEPLEHMVAEARMNGKGRWLYAEVIGAGDATGYTYDSVRTGRESLVVWRKFSSYDLRIAQTISRQLLPGWTPSPEPWLLLEDAQIDVATPDNRTGTISSALTLRVRRPGARLLTMNLVNNRDPEVYDWRSDKRKLTVRRVTDAEGHELPFSHRFHEIAVEVPRIEAPDAKVVLRFETEGDVFTDINGRHDDNYFELGRGVLFPFPSGWRGTRSSFQIKCRTKKPWKAVVSGTQVYLKEDGDFFEVESRSTRELGDLVELFGGKYVTREEKFGNLTVRIHAYAMARKNVLETMPRLAEGMIRFFEQSLGPYPFDELDIVEVPEYGFSIAPPGMVLMTTEAYQPQRDDIAKYFSRGVNNRLAHEIAHQWFGNKAAPASAEENWLAESFAEYWAGLAMGAANTDERKVVGFKGMFAAWRGEAQYCKDTGSIWSANFLGGERGGDDRYCLLYNRGPLVLHMLRTMMGNERFFGVARAFLDKADSGSATTASLARTATDVVHSDMTWFFDDWVKHSGWPEIVVEQRVEKAEGGGFVLRGKVSQAPGDGFRRILVPLVLDFGGGKVEARVVFQDEPVKTFQFPLDQQPKSVKVDPFDNNLATYKTK